MMQALFLILFAAQDDLGKERLLGRIPEEAKDPTVETWCPDGAAVVYKAWSPSLKYFLLRDGRTEEFDWIGWTLVSPDRRTVAYYATNEGQTSLTVGKERVEGFSVYSPAFHGNRFTFGAMKGRELWSKTVGAANDARGDQLLAKMPDDVEMHMELQWSADAKTVAYLGAGINAKKWCVFVGDKRGEVYDELGSLILSPDGGTIVYRAKVDKKWLVLTGEKRGKKFDEIGRPILGPDGKTPAYTARKGEKWMVVVGEKPGEEFDEVGDLPVFNPKDGSVAYRASKDSEWFLVWGDKKGPEFDGVGEPVFSPDGTTVAYPVRRSQKWAVVVGDKCGPWFDGVWKPRFTPDGKRVIHSAQQGEKIFLMIGDRRGEEFDGVTSDDAAMSPDGEVVAYPAREGDKVFMVIGGKRSEKFDQLGAPVLSPEGKKVSFGARRGSELWWKVIQVP